MSQDSDNRPPGGKAALRQHFRDARRSVTRGDRQVWTAEINRHLLASAALTGVGTVAAYLAFDGEPDVRFTLTQLCRRGIRVALPVMPERDEDGALTFHRWTPATPLAANRFGVSEPTGTAPVPLDDIDTLMTPLVAWDRTGNRLGMGAGWYDRTLAGREERPARIGVGWSLQKADALPRDAWDIPLHAVVTERGWFTCPLQTTTMER